VPGGVRQVAAGLGRGPLHRLVDHRGGPGRHRGRHRIGTPWCPAGIPISGFVDDVRTGRLGGVPEAAASGAAT
jgi:hypothetical protein